jgi:hypothetical protein
MVAVPGASIAMLPDPTAAPRVDAFPADLARLVRERWADVDLRSEPGAPVANLATPEHFLSVCYHASLLREEERAVTFRAILAARDVFPVDGIPPEGCSDSSPHDRCRSVLTPPPMPRAR